MTASGDQFAQYRDTDRGPAASLLGHRLVSIDPETGSVEVAFEATADLFNPMGVMQGGLIMAMLEMALIDAATMSHTGPNSGLHFGGKFGGKVGGGLVGGLVTLLNVHCHFLAAVGPGPLRCHARLRHGGRSTAFLEAELFAPPGTLAATATAVADFAPPGAKVS